MENEDQPTSSDAVQDAQLDLMAKMLVAQAKQMSLASALVEAIGEIDPKLKPRLSALCIEALKAMTGTASSVRDLLKAVREDE